MEVPENEEMIQVLAEFSKHNVLHIKGILNLTIPLDKSAIWILGQYLSQLGLYSESRRPLEEGKCVMYYRLNPKDMAFAMSNLLFLTFSDR